ncbi:hypothetical protein [Bacillus sp. PS06]|uniref:hypothetical protein n=1 Tax=Bacillus sp. PS06 TaxID=2764176 RepID=UPI0017806A32|nr:hypothetical protein [Bacillus sp. PS06]MBD8069636.1 hypothetical protein [Bacillus sp. PS06]
MVSYSTLFHPIALTLLVVPISIGMGLLINWKTNKILVGVLVQLAINMLFDLWFWGYFYEEGMYSEQIFTFDTLFMYVCFSGLTWILSVGLRKKRVKKME